MVTESNYEVETERLDQKFKKFKYNELLLEGIVQMKWLVTAGFGK